jgi:hypothetical protein
MARGQFAQHPNLEFIIFWQPFPGQGIFFLEKDDNAPMIDRALTRALSIPPLFSGIFLRTGTRAR